jgi:hypothetical protein
MRMYLQLVDGVFRVKMCMYALLYVCVVAGMHLSLLLTTRGL